MDQVQAEFVEGLVEQPAEKALARFPRQQRFRRWNQLRQMISQATGVIVKLPVVQRVEGYCRVFVEPRLHSGKALDPVRLSRLAQAPGHPQGG